MGNPGAEEKGRGNGAGSRGAGCQGVGNLGRISFDKTKDTREHCHDGKPSFEAEISLPSFVQLTAKVPCSNDCPFQERLEAAGRFFSFL